MPKSCCWSISYLMSYDESYAIVNEIRDLIGIGMGSNLF